MTPAAKKFIPALFLLSLMSSAAFAQGAAAPDPAAGKTLWEGNNLMCKNCHGKMGEGAFGPDLAGRGLSAAQFQHAVRKPWGVMPTFIDSQVSDSELADLAAYFASLPKVAEPGPWRFAVTAEQPHGQQVFHAAGCAQCHGPTFDFPRATLGGVNADFELFKSLVYTHTDTIGPLDASLRDGPEPAPAANRPPPRIHMGNFNPLRLSQAQLKEIYDWVKDEVGFRPMLQGKLSAGVAGPTGVTYTLTVANNGLKGKGLAAEGLAIDVALPADASVVATTGDGYKGVHMDATAKANIAEWQVRRLVAKETQTYTLTLSRAGTAADNVKGNMHWKKPGPKTGPSTDVANIAPAPIAK